MRVIVCDDEPPVRRSLDRALTLNGFQVRTAADGAAGLALVARTNPDLIVLDVLMPVINGLDVCRTLRAAGNHTPILLLTVRDSVADIVAGLDAGADDYITKPFALEELLARIRALLRRGGAGDPVLTVGDITLDVGAREVTRSGRAIQLTRTELALLELFLRNPRHALTREFICQSVWGYDFGLQSNSVEVYIGYLRRKLEAAGEPRVIHTVRGVGYVLAGAPGPAAVEPEKLTWFGSTRNGDPPRPVQR